MSASRPAPARDGRPARTRNIREVKNSLRLSSRAFREGMDAQGKAKADQAILHRLVSLREYGEAQWIYTYVSKTIEVDTLELIRRALAAGKHVAVPRCVPGTREMEFYEIRSLEELAPGKFNVVAQIDSMGNQEQGNLNGTDALTANPDAIAIFGGNDPTALGAYAAAEAAGSDALIYGVDGSPDVKALVAEGGITGTGAQSPINIGKTIAEVYYQWLAGEEVEERYPIETFMINADNVAEYGTDGWQ